MNRDVLTDHAIGCLSGFCIGNILGKQGNGMTPWQIIRKYNFIDGIFNSGDSHSEDIVQITKFIEYIVEGGKFDSEVLKSFIQNNNPTYIQKSIIIGLCSGITGLDDKEIVLLLRNGSAYKDKHEAIGILLTSIIIRESIRNYSTLQRPYDLYDSEYSLINRLFLIASKAEETLGFNQIDSFSERINLIKSRLCKNNCSLIEFAGLSGASESIFEVFSIALYSFLREPDEYKVVYKVSSIGGSSSLNSGLCGAFIGSYIGNSFISEKDILQDSAKINILVTELVGILLPEPILEEKDPTEENIEAID